MDFFQHTLNWVRGEILESVFITISGIVIVTIAVLLFKNGSAGAKAFWLPLLLVGAIMVIAGGFQVDANQRRRDQFEIRYQTETDFVLQEKGRVEQFMPLYVQVRVVVTLFFLFGMTLIWFSENRYLHGMAIGLIMLAVSALIIDYFSKERADLYYEMIQQELEIRP